MDKHSLPLITARDVWVDDVTSDLPVVRIELLASMGEPGLETAFVLAPDACRALGLALTAAADIAAAGKVEHRLDEIRLAVGRLADQVAAAPVVREILASHRMFDPAGGAR